MDSENSTGADNQQETSQPRVPLDPKLDLSGSFALPLGSIPKASSGRELSGKYWRAPQRLYAKPVEDRR
jgi:hypothetical protein